jgi:hypothetical protein
MTTINFKIGKKMTHKSLSRNKENNRFSVQLTQMSQVSKILTPMGLVISLTFDVSGV